MRIVALDLGKFKSVACVYETSEGSHRFETIATSPTQVHDLLLAEKPDRLVIEVSHLAGWVVDLAEALEIETQVANVNTEGWRWKNVKKKTDRTDGLKLARLSSMNQLPRVHIPSKQVRQWRSLIAYRHKLIERRGAMQRSTRSLLDAQGLSGSMPREREAWNGESMKRLRRLSGALKGCGIEELWRGQLRCELRALRDVQKLIDEVESKLDELGEADVRVRRLRTIPGVGPRLSELVVSIIDDPHRFKTGRQVGAYAGLVPRQYQSGESDRSGRVTRQGPGRLRKVLVEVAWGMCRHNTRGAAVFNSVCHGQKTRRKKAAVALARRALIWCWAMLRDGTEWRDPTPPRGAPPLRKTPNQKLVGASAGG